MERPEFFEALGIADQERVHTQFIAWLLSERTTPLQEHERVRFVRDLLQCQGDDGPGVPTAVLTEVAQLDLVIVAGEHLIVLENKVKSSLGLNQLHRYNSTINIFRKQVVELRIFRDVRHVHKVFLTLSGEVNANGWNDVDYEQLKKCFERLQTKDVFVRSYLAYLTRLLRFRSEYLRNHVSHPNVELNAGLTTLARLLESRQGKLTELEHFALESRLDTVFGGALLSALAKGAGAPGRHLVGETRGHSLLETTLYEFRLVARPEGKPFRVGTQLQRDTFKLNLGAGEDYGKSSRSWIVGLEEQLDVEVKEHWDESLGKVEPHSARTRAYRSWILQTRAAGRLSKTPLEDYVPIHKARVEAAHRVWRAVLENLKTVGLVGNIVEVRGCVQSNRAFANE